MTAPCGAAGTLFEPRAVRGLDALGSQGPHQRCARDTADVGEVGLANRVHERRVGRVLGFGRVVPDIGPSRPAGRCHSLGASVLVSITPRLADLVRLELRDGCVLGQREPAHRCRYVVKVPARRDDESACLVQGVNVAQ